MNGLPTPVARGGVLLALGMALALSRPDAAGARPAGQAWVDGRTQVWVQNLDPSENANILVDFYPVPGAPPTTLQDQLQRLLLPGQSIRYDSPQPRAGLGQLGQFAVIVRSNRRVAALNRTEEPLTSAAVMYNNVDVAERIIVPLVVRQFSKPTDITSVVSIQSTEKNPQIQTDTEYYSKTYYRHGPNSTTYTAIPNAMLPNTLVNRNTGGTWMIDMDQPPYDQVDNRPPPQGTQLTGTLGWMRLIPRQGGSPEVHKVGAETYLNLRTVNTAVSGFAGIPESFRSRTLYAPLIRANFAGITGIAVVNPSATPATIRATYFGSPLSADPACRNRSFIHYGDLAKTQDTITIAPNDQVVLYHIPGDPPVTAPGNVGNPALPNGCFGSGMVEVLSGDGLIGMVNDFSLNRNGVPYTAAGYVAVRPEDAAVRIAAPVVMHDAVRPPGESLPRTHTGIQVMNVDPSRNVNATISYFDSLGAPVPPGAPPADRNVTIPARGSHTWWSGSMNGLSGLNGFEGSAVVTADGPIAAVVTVHRYSSDSVTYNAFKADWPPIQ